MFINFDEFFLCRSYIRIWALVVGRFNWTPTSYSHQFSYALLLRMKVLDYPPIFVTIFPYVIHLHMFVSRLSCWSWLDNLILPSLFDLQHRKCSPFICLCSFYILFAIIIFNVSVTFSISKDQIFIFYGPYYH